MAQYIPPITQLLQQPQGRQLSNEAYSNYGWRYPGIYSPMAGANTPSGLAEQKFGYETQLGGQQQEYNLANLLAQFGYQQQLGTQQQGFTQENLATQLANALRLGEQGYGFQKGLGEQQQGFTKENLLTQLANTLKLGEAQFGQQSKLSEQSAKQQAGLLSKQAQLEIEDRANRMRIAEDIFGRGTTGLEASLQSQAGLESEMVGRQWEDLQRGIEADYARGGASLSSAREQAMAGGRGAMADALRRARTTVGVEAGRTRAGMLAQLLSLVGR